MDYRLKKPQLLLFHVRCFVSKVTMRQTARMSGAALDTVAHHQRLLGAHARLMNRALVERGNREGHKRRRAIVAFDELETFEQSRTWGPVTVPVVVDAESLLIFDAEVAAMAPRRPRRDRIERSCPTTGNRHRRRSGSRMAVRASLRRTAALLPHIENLTLISDRKSTYPNAIARAFTARSLRHVRVSSKAPRTTRNPLFPANLTLAMMRDGISRLVRRTWAHSKLRGRLRLHLWIWISWRNWCRDRSNALTGQTPGMCSGLIDEKLTLGRFLGWHGRFAELAGRR